MLLQFSCRNFRSIKEPVLFSMLPPKDTADKDKKTFRNGDKITKVAAIYGANGSGKSNLIRAVEFAKSCVVNSILHQPGIPIFQQSHKLSAPEDPSSFDFQFTVGGTRYAYGFSLIEGLVSEEYLYFFPSGRRKKVFEREGMTIVPGSSYKGKFQTALGVLKDNRLFLACLANYSPLEEADKAFQFFSRDLVIFRTKIDEPGTDTWYEYSMNLIQKAPGAKKVFLDFLRVLGTGITDVRIVSREVSSENLAKSLPESLRNFFMETIQQKKKVTTSQTSAVYPEFSTDLLTEESTGIIKLFKIICPLWDIIVNGKTLFCDEIEAGLHEAVLLKLIDLFKDLSSETDAQLIFTTHNTNILSKNLLSRDQIWFTELAPGRATDLYSLIEIRDVRKDENLERGYISGKYGAIPVLNDEPFRL